MKRQINTHELMHKVTNQLKVLEKKEEPKDFLIATRIGPTTRKLQKVKPKPKVMKSTS